MDYMTDERQLELLNQLSEEVKIVIQRMGLADVWKLKLENDSGCDPMLTIEDSGICVIAYLDTKNLKGQKEWFCLGHVVYYPGVRYYKDGSGEPPSEDFVEDECLEVTQLQKAVEKMLTLAFSFVLDEALTSRAEDKMYEDIEDITD